MFLSLLTYLPSVSARDLSGEQLQKFCPTKDNLKVKKGGVVPEWYPDAGFFNWTNVPQDRWYWGNDWDEFQANGTDPFPGDPPTPYYRPDAIGKQELFPAGFKRYTLAWYNEPTLCLRVPGSGDKKVEVLLESDVENANFCIHDASDLGVNTNNVGNVNVCGSGQVYACFTAATNDENAASAHKDFGFYVSCQDGCEQADMTVWIRVRLSTQTWDKGKTSTQDDLEMWCENEKGTFVNDDEKGNRYYTYPTDLIPDQPSKWPFHVQHLFGGQNAGGLVGVTRVQMLLPFLFCLAYLFA